MTRPLAGLVIITLLGMAMPCAADPVSQQDMLVLGRVDHFCQRGQWEAAATELGRLSKPAQASPVARRYLQMAMGRLYVPTVPARQTGRPRRPPRPLVATPPRATPPPIPGSFWEELKERAAASHVATQSRIAHRAIDADENSDQIFDERGWEINNQWVTDTDLRGWRHTTRGSIDGYQNGKNDLRWRQMTYQARYEDEVRITVGDIRSYLTHHAVSDPSNPAVGYAGYTLRSTQLRGLDLQLASGPNDFHLMAGAIPFYLSPSDEYIYPRHVLGLRDSYRVTPWYRAGLGMSFVSDDSSQLSHVNEVLQAHDTNTFSIEQDLTLIPGHWLINTEHAYSATNTSEQVRFGSEDLFHGTAHSLLSEWRWPTLRVLGSYERVSPEFLAPSDISTLGSVNSKNVSSGREHVTLRVYPRPVGPVYGDLQYSRSRNNLNDRRDVEMTREHWLTTQGGVQLPEPWPQPSARATFIRTVSVPGSTFSASARWLYDLSTELRKRWQDWDWTGGLQYLRSNNDERTAVDDEYRRGWSLRAGRTVWPGGYFSTRGGWTRVQDRFNNTTMQSRWEQEFGMTLSSKLWSNATWSGSYAYRDTGTPTVVEPSIQSAGGAFSHIYSTSFAWPYTVRLRRGRSLSVSPSLYLNYVDTSDDLQRHYTVGSRLTTRYAIRDAYRWEFLLEHHQDDDAEITRVSAQDWRMWLLFTTKLGPALEHESALR